MTTYTPTVWADGDPITAAKLNKIENRLVELHNENTSIVEPIIIDEETTGTFDITWQEAYDLLEEGFLIPIFIESRTNNVDWIISAYQDEYNNYKTQSAFHHPLDADSANS